MPTEGNWTVDEPCGSLTLGEHTGTLRLRACTQEEDFERHTAAREFVPLTIARGRRIVVKAHFYTAEPEFMPTDLRQSCIGDGEAYYYLADEILLLWRCNLLNRYRAADPTADPVLHAIWNVFEAFLRRQFPHARLIVTPAWNRPYDQALWREYTRQCGFLADSPVGLPGMALIKDIWGGD